MYKNFNLTDAERQQIFEMHEKRGYKNPINEEKAILNEYFFHPMLMIAHDLVPTIVKAINDNYDNGDLKFDQLEDESKIQMIDSLGQFISHYLKNHYFPEQSNEKYYKNTDTQADVKDEPTYDEPFKPEEPSGAQLNEGKIILKSIFNKFK